MESEKPHRRGVSTSDLFLCFSSRSSMKIPSSRSMPSPGRSRGEPSLSLSSSLSRRLRSNGSMKGGQGQASPMFPTGSKKKGGNGGAFEPAEPTSPKVTCIGQVRVKTKKKHGRKMRTRSKRRGGGGGEVSFRKGEDGEGLKGRNQRWVHLPLTICEALKGLGACSGKSGCSWGKVEKRKTRSSIRSGSCGAVFTRWFFTVDEKREIVRGEERLEEEEEDGRREMRERFREIEVEILEEKVEMQEVIEGDDEDEEARLSICIPPKNALLLMRCRSEPFRNSSLANRFWESPAPNVVDDDEDEDEDNEEEEVEDIDEEVVAEVGIEEKRKELEEKKEDEEVMESEEGKNPLEEETPEAQEVENPSIEETPETEMQEKSETEEEKTEEQEPQAVEEDILLNRPSISTREALVREEEKPERDEEEEPKIQENEEENARVSSSSPTLSVQEEEEEDEEEQSEAEPGTEEQLETVEEEEAAALVEKSTEEQTVPEVKQEVRQTNGQDEERETASSSSPDVLPDCLLLMMCEPKLSMEVSKETWVCSTDFISFRHHHPEKKSNAGDETKKRLSTDSRPTPRPQQRQSPVRPAQKPKYHRQKQKQKIQNQPARSSFSGPTMANMIEQKLVNAAAYEPFVLTRCKSEPVRSSSKLAPEACFWKSRKVEPHRTPGLGVGAAGIGV